MNMIELKRQLCPVQSLDFEDMVSFRTESYVGMYEYGIEQYVIFPIADCQLDVGYLGTPKNYDELDDEVYEMVGEHITHVSGDCHYHFVLECSGEVD